MREKRNRERINEQCCVCLTCRKREIESEKQRGERRDSVCERKKPRARQRGIGSERKS